MYTDGVVRLRSVALVLAFLFVATPLLAAVCEIDCDQPPVASACHNAAVPEGATVRGAQHACGHDHATGRPALLAGASARDSIATLVAAAVPALAHASVHSARVAAGASHGPPGLIGRSTSSRIAILRI
jgi:hypothetical protein